MAASMQKVLVGDALSDGSRSQLQTWLIGDKVGDKRLRAGLPPSWRIGDKTGTGERGSTNAVAIIWPPVARPHRHGLLHGIIRFRGCAQRGS